MPQMSIAEALREAIREELRRDPRVFCIGEDIGKDLLETGVNIEIKEKPGSALFIYKRVE